MSRVKVEQEDADWKCGWLARRVQDLPQSQHVSRQVHWYNDRAWIDVWWLSRFHKRCKTLIEITLDKTWPVHCASYRAGPGVLALEKLEIDMMLSMGFIERAKQKCTVPIVATPKEDSFLIFFVHYRKVNPVTVRDPTHFKNGRVNWLVRWCTNIPPAWPQNWLFASRGRSWRAPQNSFHFTSLAVRIFKMATWIVQNSRPILTNYAGNIMAYWMTICPSLSSWYFHIYPNSRRTNIACSSRTVPPTKIWHLTDS